jgi:lipoate-protein ligase A
MAKTWRLILDEKHAGSYNMAADEAILTNYPTTKIPTLRIYGWKPPCISLGYNQAVDNVLASTTAFPFVRRITGGASILHDQEITYSISCALSDLNLPKGVKESYKTLCSFIIDFYSQLGLNAQFAKDVVPEKLHAYGNFCFSSCEEFDLTIAGKKIGGNAQRRKKEIIFQHGSIPQEIDFFLIQRLIKDSHAAACATSLAQLLNKKQDFYLLRNQLSESFAKVFGIKSIPDSLCTKEVALRDRLIVEKYETRDWNVLRHLKSEHPGLESKTAVLQ